MAFFGQRHRRHRSSRASTIKASRGLVSRAFSMLKDRSTLARVTACLVAILVLTIIVEGWRAPLEFRPGDRSDHGVLATVQFSRVNHDETDRLRQQKEERVPLHFQRSPLDTTLLSDQLRTDFRTVADANVGTDLSPELSLVFGLRAEESTDSDPEQPAVNEPEFARLRDLVRAMDAQDGVTQQTRMERIEGLLAEFQRLLSEIDRLGLVDQKDVSAHGIGKDQMLVIVSEEANSDTPVNYKDVDLVEMLSPTGRLNVVWETMPMLSRIRPRVEAWLTSSLRPTLRYDRQRTLQEQVVARSTVDEVREIWYPGQVLVGAGELLREKELSLLSDEHAAAVAAMPLHLRLIRALTVVLMISVLAVINGYYLVRNEPRFTKSWPRLIIYLLSIIAAVAVGRWLATFPHQPEIIPVVLIAMIFAVTCNQVMAAMTALTVSLILTLATGEDLSHFVILMAVSATSIILLTHVPSRATLTRVGFITGCVFLGLFVGMEILRGSSLTIVWGNGWLLSEGLIGAGWCLAAGILLTVTLPFIESGFGVVTDISLLEMGDISHPLLQELVRRAPGTYNHSISVASIGETAADAIGANGLLVRVGAYFHDIGKILKPEYFVENMTEGMKSRHSSLAPAMSTLIIIGHVKDGIDLAQQHHLPQPLIDFIEQHHGTTLVKYFYHEAMEQAKAKEDAPEVAESSFRYPGPRPQTKEAGVMLLSDAVESASRTLSEPTPRRIETLVHEITMDKLLDGQFEESSLTLSDVRTVEESLIKSLTAIYHGRIKYPEQQRTA
ncbi:MAG: HDIG domain-containing protein [Planctomycetota bacterium]|nr:HDIG domain-containing protein [Planctomycetota bacterium]MDA1248906.1 HDIG domain-containing protein [Planctomycetota bacterium]